MLGLADSRAAAARRHTTEPWPRAKIVDVVFVFSILFGIYFAGDLNTAAAIEIVLALFWIRHPILPKGNLPVALFMILLASMTYSAAIYLGNSMIDASYPIRFARSIITFCATAWTVRYMLRERRLAGIARWVYVSDVLLVVLGIHALVVFMQFVHHPFRDAIYQYWSHYPLDRLTDWRVLGLTRGAAIPSYLQVLGFYIAWDKVTRRESAFPMWVVMGIGLGSLGAVFLIAQTGVLFFVASFLPFVLLAARRGSGRTGLVRAGAFLAIFLGIAAGVWTLAVSRLDEDLLGNVELSIATKTDVIWSVIAGTEITNVSFRDIAETMYFVPKDLQTFLFGNSLGLREGNLADPVDRLRADTDVGYVTNIWGIGVIGLAISVAFYVAILGFAVRQWVRGRCSGGAAILTIASIFFLVGHAKESHLFTRTGFELYLLILWSVYYSVNSYQLEDATTLEGVLVRT